MKRIPALFAILLMLGSIVVVAEDLEIQPIDPCEDVDNEEDCQDEDCIVEDGDNETEVCPEPQPESVPKQEPKQEESNYGSSSFFLRKGRKLFGLKSQKEGFLGGGIVLGNIFAGRVLKLYHPRDILSVTIYSNTLQRGLKAYHLKKVPMDGPVFAYEFLSNMDNEETTYSFYVKVPSNKDVEFRLDGKLLTAVEVNKGKSKAFNYYNVILEEDGILEVLQKN